MAGADKLIRSLKLPDVRSTLPPASFAVNSLVRNCLATSLLVLVCAGCPQQTAPPQPTPPSTEPAKPLRLIVVDDPDLAAAANRQWNARSETQLHIVAWTRAELQSAIEATADDRQALSADAVIYPVETMSDLVQRELISEMPDFVRRGNFASDDYAEDDLLPLVRSVSTRWGTQTYAVSLGQPVMVLGYRADILECVGARPPKTWDELNQLVETIASFDFSSHEALKPEFVLAQPLSGNWAAETLLARAVAAARSRARFSTLFDLRSMDAMIGNDAYVQALTTMLAQQKHGSELAKEWNPGDSMEALRSGRCALAIGWPQVQLNSDTQSPVAESVPARRRIQMVPLPGSERVFSVSSQEWQTLENGGSQNVTYLPAAGRCGSVLKRTRRQRAAWGMLARLSGQEWGMSVCSASQSSAIFRYSQRASVDRWLGTDWSTETSDAYADAVKDSLSNLLFVSSPRLPFADKYRSTLATAVRKTQEGDETAAAALAAAAKAWNEITEKAEKSKQSAAYHLSLGLEP
jgi:multiple sugar transport system substrate-binding protein